MDTRHTSNLFHQGLCMAFRKDRYCTPQNAMAVYLYLSDDARLKNLMHVLKVPGFHREKFKADFKALHDENPTSMHARLSTLLASADKSDKDQFRSLKARVRRHLFTRKGQVQLVIERDTMDKLQELMNLERVGTVGEIVEMLIATWNLSRSNLLP